MASKSQAPTVVPNDAFKLKALHDAFFSPKGDKVVYGVFETCVEEEKDFVNLWLLDLKSGETRQLTQGHFRNYSPVWSPDGSMIAFISTRGDKPQVYQLPVDGGEALRITDLKQGVGGGLTWSPDGKKLAFSAGPETLMDTTKPFQLTRTVIRFDGMGFLDNSVQDIYVLDLATKEVKQLTNDKSNNSAPAWSPDSKSLLYAVSMKPDAVSFSAELRLTDLAGKSKQVGDNNLMVEGYAWHPNGKQVLMVADRLDGKIGEKNDLYVVDLKTNKATLRTKNLPFSMGGALRGDFPIAWRAMGRPLVLPTPDGKFAYTMVHDGGTMQTYRIALTGAEKCEALSTRRDTSTVIMDMSADKLLCAVADFYNPGDLYLMDLEGKKPKRLTDLNSKTLAGMTLGKVEAFTFKNKAGDKIEGWIMLPQTGKKPYPTVLYIHGGPHSAYGNVFSFDYHMLAGAGYAVLFVNPRGSGGYGNDFATCIIGNWGDLAYDDLMQAVDLMIDRGHTDGNRLACYGLSYGGYMVNWIVGHTHRFKAAISENPVTNLFSMYGTSDIGAFFNGLEMGALPHEDIDLYVKQSPYFYAHTARTPILMIQGEADFRCPAEQTEQVYTIYKVNSCETEMLRLPNSPHGGSIAGSFHTRKAANEAFVEWCDRYVKSPKKK